MWTSSVHPPATALPFPFLCPYLRPPFPPAHTCAPHPPPSRPFPRAPLPPPLPIVVPSPACTPCSPCSAPLPFPLPMYTCPLLALCPCLRIINTYLFIYLLHSHLITK